MRFYFTFGSAEQYPFKRDDYVVVEAKTMLSAQRLFMAIHPNPRDNDVVNCADNYTEEQWLKIASQYYKDREPIETISANVGYRASNRPCPERDNEISTKCLHALFDADPESAIEFYDDELEMEDSEKDYYGLTERIRKYYNNEEEE